MKRSKTRVHHASPAKIAAHVRIAVIVDLVVMAAVDGIGVPAVTAETAIAARVGNAQKAAKAATPTSFQLS